MNYMFPEIPNAHAAFAMAATVFALFMFTRKSIALEVSSMVLLGLLTLVFAIFPFPGFDAVELYTGFGHEALITVCALMVMGQGMAGLTNAFGSGNPDPQCCFKCFYQQHPDCGTAAAYTDQCVDAH